MQCSWYQILQYSKGPAIAAPRDQLAKGALFVSGEAKSTQYFMIYKIMQEPLVASSYCFVSAAHATKALSHNNSSPWA